MTIVARTVDNGTGTDYSVIADSVTVDSVTGDSQMVRETPVSSASLGSLASSTSSAQLLAANAVRRGLLVTNTDKNRVYLKYGTTASQTSFTVVIPQDGYWEMPEPIYTGRIDAIWSGNGSGSAYYTEL